MCSRTIHRLDLTLRPTEDTIDDDRPHAGFEPTPDAASPPTVYEFSTDFIDDTVAVDGVGVVKQGFLWKRSTNMRKDWKRRWFMMRGGEHSCLYVWYVGEVRVCRQAVLHSTGATRDDRPTHRRCKRYTTVLCQRVQERRGLEVLFRSTCLRLSYTEPH
jgi:hypothetical protein